MAQSNEDILLKNVADLRKKLIRTERNLQLLQTPSPDKRYRHRYAEDVLEPEERVPPLTLDDLTPEHLGSSMSSIRSTDGIHDRNSKRRSRSLRTGSWKSSHRKEEFEVGHEIQENTSLSSLMSSSSVQESTENFRLRRKLQTLREENAGLVTENHSLQNKIESSQYELRLTKGQLKMISIEVEASRSSVDTLKGKCDSLRVELKANDAALRMAERSLDESGRQLSERESVVHRHRQEVKKIKLEVVEERKLRERIEAQRDETAQKLEVISEELDSYRILTDQQLNKLSTSEEHLRGSLLHCDREREELLERATSLEEELQDARDQMRMLQESGSKLSVSETSLKEARSRSKEQGRRIQHLETELDVRRRENRELAELTERQSERLVGCQKDIETSRTQLHKLEALVERQKKEGNQRSSNGRQVYRELFSTPSMNLGLDSGIEPESEIGSTHSQTVISELRFQLATKEVEVQQLRSFQSGRDGQQASSSASMPAVGGSASPTGLRAQLAALMERSKLGEKKSQELEKVIGQLNSQAAKRANEIARLKQELSNSDAGKTSLESRMSLRDSQLGQLHGEIQEKASQMLDLQRDLKKSKGQISVLESQLEEKTSAFSSHVSQLEDLQKELGAMSKQLISAKEELRKRDSSAESLTAQAKEVKRVSQEQCQELHQQLHLMQRKLDHESEELQAAQDARSRLQREVGQKEERLKRLQEDLAESQKEVVKKNVENQRLWNSLQSKSDEGTLRLAQMDAALEVCKQEITMYVTQLEDSKKKHAHDIELKDKEVADLDERWRKATAEMEERGMRSSELEQALREGQGMLQQSAQRIGELEDREGQLQHQISSLSRELNKAKSSAAQEVDTVEKKLGQVCQDLENRNQELQDLKNQLSTAQSKLTQSQSEVEDLGQRLRESRQDGENRGEKASQLEEELQVARAKLDEAQSNVKELEEVLARTRDDSKQTKERCRSLDDELQQAQDDLRSAANQLGELHRLLQRSKAESQLKQDRVQELNESLKKSQDEMRTKERDLAEMDLALRTSQRELLHRSAQVSQLDVTVKERQSEMERKILQLETSLNKSQYQLKQSQQKISDLEEHEETQREESRKREQQVQDLEQNLRSQNNEVTLKTKKVSILEERIEDLTRDLKKQKEDYLEQTQQLRLGREQTQQAHVTITDMQRQLAQAQREKDNLSSELEEALERCRIKDADLARLAEEVGATRAQELALQAQYTAELQHIAKLRDAEVEIKEEEVIQLQASHAQLLASRDQLDSAHRLQVNQVREAELRSSEDLVEARKTVVNLESDLAAAKEVINATNEAIVIKESEIARLNAKLSSYERLMSKSNTNQSPQRLSPHHTQSPAATPHFSSSPNLSSPQHRLSTSLGENSFHESPTRISLEHADPEKLAPRRLSDFGGYSEGAAARTSIDSVYVDALSPGLTDSMQRLVTRDLSPSNLRNAGDISTATTLHQSRTVQIREESRVKCERRMDAFSDVTDASSVISGIERLPEREPGGEPGTFQAMLEFVNRQILAQDGIEATDPDTNWLDLEDMSDGSLLGSARSGRSSAQATGSLSPSSPLKSTNSSPASHSAPPTPDTPRRRSGIPLRKSSSPARRPLHFSKGVSSVSAQSSTHGRKLKGRKGQTNRSQRPTDRDSDTSEAVPLKQKLANQKAKLASHGRNKPIGSSQLKPKECLADLRAKLKANDARRQEVDRQLFGVL